MPLVIVSVNSVNLLGAYIENTEENAASIIAIIINSLYPLAYINSFLIAPQKSFGFSVCPIGPLSLLSTFILSFDPK